MTRFALALSHSLLRKPTSSTGFAPLSSRFLTNTSTDRSKAAFTFPWSSESQNQHKFDTMSKKVILATCSLNQWANDFKGNYERIRKSVLEAKAKGARFRLGPELEIPGYSCQDHFFEYDTEKHSWEVLSKLLQDEQLQGIIIDTGMPIRHKQTIYNCRVLILNGRILFVRPKLVMSNTGNYRESRWFTPWRKHYAVEEYLLPTEIQKVTSQRTVPIGDAILMTNDTTIGTEICEELWAPLSKHIALGLDGCEIITNPSSSHHELRKAHRVFNLIHSATLKGGGIYLYANQFGCDGDRLNFNGVASIALNGQFVVQGRQFAIADVEVLTAIVDLNDVRGFRGQMSSRGDAAAEQKAHPVIEVDFTLSMPNDVFVTVGQKPAGGDRNVPPTAEEEIALGPAVWLWDYLRRSKSAGYLLPLSGGTDSSATACIIYSMCTLVVEAAKQGDEQVLSDVRAVTGDDSYTPESAQEFCSRIFVTIYMASQHSSNKTRERARKLAEAIGSHHLEIKIDESVEAVYKQFTDVTGKTPRIGGSADIDPREDLAQQNVQARVRMVMAYHFAKLMPWTRGGRSSLLVLGSANVDESLRGYMTKYDNSSADVNPIGGISKVDLRKFLRYCVDKFNLTVVEDILQAKPTAELRPLDETGSYSQTDEEDMGMTYEELSMYGRLRKQQLCGPLSMFEKLAFDWRDKLPPKVVAKKVKDFFRFYAINRHKMTTLTPSYHAESYSPDDNRFDHRQFLYNINWDWQFEAIDREAERLEQAWNAQKQRRASEGVDDKLNVDAELPAENMVANEKI